MIFVIENANAVLWEKALAGAQVGSKHRPLLVDACLIVCVKWVGGLSLVIRTQVSTSQNILTIVTNCWESPQRGWRRREGKHFCCPILQAFPFQQWVMENSSVYGKSLGGIGAENYTHC